MINRLWTAYKLSHAVQIVKAALRFMPIAPFDVEVFAPKFVARVYASNANLFDGSGGPRPHAISTAAVALAQAMDDDFFQFEFPQTAKNHLFLALGNVLLDASRNQARYRLHAGDQRMLHIAENVYLRHAEQTRDDRDAIVGSLGLPEET